MLQDSCGVFGDTYYKSDAEEGGRNGGYGSSADSSNINKDANKYGCCCEQPSKCDLFYPAGWEYAGQREEMQGSTVSEAQIIEAIEHANKAFRIVSTRFEFSIHEGTKEIMVKVIDEQTNEVIREIPPEKILDIVAKLWELVGIIVDEKA